MENAKPWLQPGKWHVNPAYWDPEAIELRQYMPKRVRFIDVTMIEGDDVVGHQLNWNTRLELIQRLDAIGIGYITMPSHSKIAEEEDLARAYRRLKLKAKMIFMGPGMNISRVRGQDWKGRVDRGIAMDADVICPGIGWGYEDSLSDFTKDIRKDEILYYIQEIVHYVKSKSRKVMPWIQDTMRGSSANAVLFARAMVDAGADGVYLVDSRGNSHPIATRVIVRKVKEAVGDRDVAVQHHNDLGVSTANALADVEAGANLVDCTVLGTGDRGGTVSLEETACMLEMYGVDTGIDLQGLYELCRFTRDAYGLSLSPWKAVIGENWNKEEGMGHTAGLYAKDKQDLSGKEPSNSYISFGIAPEVVGRPMELVIGNKILFGKERSSHWTDDPQFLTDLLDRWGLKVDQTQFDRILLRAQAAVSTTHPRNYITMDEMRSIVDGVIIDGPSKK